MDDQTNNPFAAPGTWIDAEQRKRRREVSGEALKAVEPLVSFLLTNRAEAVAKAEVYFVGAFYEEVPARRWPFTKTVPVLQYRPGDEPHFYSEWGTGGMTPTGKWNWTAIDLGAQELQPPELTPEDRESLTRYAIEMKKHLSVILEGLPKVDPQRLKKYWRPDELKNIEDTLDDLLISVRNPDYRRKDDRPPAYYLNISRALPFFRGDVSKIFAALGEQSPDEVKPIYQAKNALADLTAEHAGPLKRMTHALLYRHAVHELARYRS